VDFVLALRNVFLHGGVVIVQVSSYTIVDKACSAPDVVLGSLSKPRRRGQRKRHKTKGLMSKTVAVHVRYKSLYTSLPSSAQLQREMTMENGNDGG